MSPAPQEVLDLVERFAHNMDRYHRADYNETQARREFIDPFFAALGWDVENRRGVAPQYQEVIHEATLRDRGSVKAPDYCFRVGPERKFFVEAKKPAVDIREGIHPAYQLRRYAWSAKLPLSILTDFEEFSVYDCRIPPKPADKAATARILYVHYADYPARWDEIAAIFAREAVWRGDYDRYAETARGKRGTQEVDAVFLQQMEAWRTLLAQNIALRNPQIASVRDLNFAVQKTIDRVIFLRITEDRDIEPYEQLKHIAENGGVYANLLGLFRRADERYNSGLFHFRDEKGCAEAPDTLTPGLAVDDKALREIIGSLYYPESPYEFSVLGADILGNVYEQFLGSVIRLTPAHRAVVEQKPEVRKAGGVYYTPKYIVEYIVKNTVGKLCEGKTPGEISKLRILDPACGSGSFLLGAYQHLLDTHRDWYAAHPTKQARREVYQGIGGEWFLTTEEKKRILLNNIYGVDIDPQAVEVTKLSLLLKVLEGETAASLATQLELMPERALPDLAANIKCGNSLIGPDFYDGRQMSLLDNEEAQRINAFDWHAEFPEVFHREGAKDAKEGGFDAVIGNPPYVNIRLLTQEQGDQVKQYFREGYRCAQRGYDIYVLFIERGFQLLKSSGFFGMIVPNKLATLDYARECRSMLVEQTAIWRIADVSTLGVFSGASVYPYILVWEKANPEEDHKIAIIEAQCVADVASDSPTSHVRQSSLSVEQGFSLHGTLDIESRVPTLPLGEKATLHSGTTGFSAQKIAGQIKEHEDVASRQYYDFIVSGNIDRYIIRTGNVRFMKLTFRRPVLIRSSEHLTSRKHALYRSQKIVIAGMTKRLEAALDQGGLALGVQVYAVADPTDDLRYLLGILNSRLLSFLFRLRFQAKHLAGGFLAINKRQLEQLPIRTINFSDPADAARHDRMVALVERMLDLHKRLAAAQTPTDKTLLQRQITATDKEIDRLVYDLYGLTDEEIAVVEGGSG